MFEGYEAKGIFSKGFRGGALAVILVILLALLIGFAAGRASAAELQLGGSQVLTLERADDGELYASLSIVLDYPLTASVSLVAIHDQSALFTGDFPRLTRHERQWDLGLAWRPSPGWSVTVGRRWSPDTLPDYGGPWTYIQVWRGL